MELGARFGQRSAGFGVARDDRCILRSGCTRGCGAGVLRIALSPAVVAGCCARDVRKEEALAFCFLVLARPVASGRGSNYHHFHLLPAQGPLPLLLTPSPPPEIPKARPSVRPHVRASN
eukprot:959642-Prymnesium_polylepis.1